MFKTWKTRYRIPGHAKSIIIVHVIKTPICYMLSEYKATILLLPQILNKGLVKGFENLYILALQI